MIKNAYAVLIGVAFLTKSIQAQCIHCDSDQDETCNNPIANFSSTPCSDGGAKCFVRVVDGRVIRGCQSDLSSDVLSKCTTSENDISCRICEFGACNNGMYPPNRSLCHKCGLSNETVNCALEVHTVASPCKRYMPDDKCIVRKNENQVIRQCLSDYEDCAKDKTCKTCGGTGCNKDLYNAATEMKTSFLFIGLVIFVSKLF